MARPGPRSVRKYSDEFNLTAVRLGQQPGIQARCRTRKKRRLQLSAALTPRRWGTLTPHEMLCHLDDAAEMVLRIRPRDRPVALRR